MKQVLSIVLFCLVVLTAYVSAIQSTIPKSTLENIHSTLLTKVKQSSQTTPVKDLHFNLVSLLKLPYKKDESKKAIDDSKDRLCQSLLKSGDSVASLSLNDLYNTIAATSALKCDVSEEIAKSIESRLTALIAKVSTYEDYYDAARSIFLFRRNLPTLTADKQVCVICLIHD
jgi:hypothetical protein